MTSSSLPSLFAHTGPLSAGQGAGTGTHRAIWRQLDAESCRVALFDMLTLQPLDGRWMRDNGNLTGETDSKELEAFFHVAKPLVTKWAGDAAGDEQQALQVQMLSPRRWVYLWRTEGDIGLLAQVHYLSLRNMPQDFDSSSVQLVCEDWLRPERLARFQARQAAARLPWNRVERRASRAGLPSPLVLLAATFLALVVAAAGFLGAGTLAAEQQQAHESELTRLSEVADRIGTKSLAYAMSSDDYGEVQEVLTAKAAAGYFGAAAVTNSKGQVVALVGSPQGLRIGLPVSDDIRVAGRALPLSSGNNDIGELLVLKPSAVTERPPNLATGLFVAAGLLGVVLLAAAAWAWMVMRRT